MMDNEIRLPDPPVPGADRVSRVNGHQIEITVTALLPAPVYRAECVDCDAVLHEGTTEPLEVAQRHIVNRPLGWPEGLDWNNTGPWAVVLMIAGSADASGGRRWVVHPSFSVSRWETREHAQRHADSRRKEGVATTAVITWGDDLKELATNPRVRVALVPGEDKYGRQIDECPKNKRHQYPSSPDCCGSPMVLYLATSLYEGTQMMMIGGYLLRCSQCGNQVDVDLLVSSLAGSWVREVL